MYLKRIDSLRVNLASHLTVFHPALTEVSTVEEGEDVTLHVVYK